MNHARLRTNFPRLLNVFSAIETLNHTQDLTHTVSKHEEDGREPTRL